MGRVEDTKGQIPWPSPPTLTTCALRVEDHTRGITTDIPQGQAAAGIAGDRRWIRLPFIPCSKKNRTRVYKGRGIPDPLVREHTRILQLVASTCQIRGPWTGEVSLAIHVFRRTPKEEKTGKRNPRRGDLHNIPGLICDALEGLWWADDEQVTEQYYRETRCYSENLVFINAAERP